MSETSRCRERLSKFCGKMGLDIGFGGDPILPNSICIDLPNPYTTVGEHPQHLFGLAQDLYWFADNCLDYVFSSHLIEDFRYNQQIGVISEWLRVLRHGGHLVLYTVHQQRFLQHCKSTGQGLNLAHKEDDYSLEAFLCRVIPFLQSSRFSIIHQNPQVEDYSWEIVLQKL